VGADAMLPAFDAGDWPTPGNPSTISMMVRLRAILLWLLMLAVPFQGYAAAAMTFCAPEPAAHASSGAVHDHSGHDHGTQGVEHHHANASSDDSVDHHDASSAHDDSSDAAHKCGNCAACHSVGMTPTLDTPLLHGLPQADLAEPLRAMATVSPSVPHKPPRA
jgi:cytochrome c553